MADLSGLLLSEEDPETTLRRVSDLAVRSIVHCDALGVTLFVADRATTRAATWGLVHEVYHFQCDIGEGPYLQAIHDRDVIEVEDMATEARWRRFCQHAASVGSAAHCRFPLLMRASPWAPSTSTPTTRRVSTRRTWRGTSKSENRKLQHVAEEIVRTAMESEGRSQG